MYLACAGRDRLTVLGVAMNLAVEAGLERACWRPNATGVHTRVCSEIIVASQHIYLC